MSYVKQLSQKQLIFPPEFVKSGLQYETIMGSMSYGVSSNSSDIDIYGFCIPHKEIIFPHLKGEILGFSQQTERFEQWQKHHVKDASNDKEYDFSIYNIVKYLHLCMKCNPNMIDSLFTPIRCVTYCSQIGNLVRENRRLFLHKGAWFKFKGYSYSQIHKMETKNPIGKRKETIAKFGYDVKFGYHVVRLLNEIEMILTEGDLDLERNREQLKSIRRGEWKKEDILDYFNKKERELESLYTNSKLPHGPDEDKIKQLLLNCLEMHYGSLGKAVHKEHTIANILHDLESVINKYKANE